MRCSNVLFIDNFVGNITADSQCNKNVHKVMKSLGRERWVIFCKNKIRAYAYTQGLEVCVESGKYLLIMAVSLFLKACLMLLPIIH